MSDTPSAFFKHLISVDLICSLAVSLPGLATARVLELQFGCQLSAPPDPFAACALSQCVYQVAMQDTQLYGT